MNMADDPFAACEEAVRRHDPDRYFAGLFAPEEKRRPLFVLAALYYELAHAVVARRMGVSVGSVTLWLFGGVTTLGEAAQSFRIGQCVRQGRCHALGTEQLTGACFGAAR